MFHSDRSARDENLCETCLSIFLVLNVEIQMSHHEKVKSCKEVTEVGVTETTLTTAQRGFFQTSVHTLLPYTTIFHLIRILLVDQQIQENCFLYKGVIPTASVTLVASFSRIRGGM